jgi:hypothetical protein
MTIFLFTLVAVLAAKVVYFHVTSGLIQTYWSLFTFIVCVMKKTLVPWSDVPQLAKSDIAYVTGDPLLRPFYVYEPKLSAFDEVIRARSAFSTPRTALADVLEAQYASLPHTPAVSDHISSLRDDNSFTVTTAHQPCLFGSPLLHLQGGFHDKTGPKYHCFQYAWKQGNTCFCAGERRSRSGGTESCAAVQ